VGEKVWWGQVAGVVVVGGRWGRQTHPPTLAEIIAEIQYGHTIIHTLNIE